MFATCRWTVCSLRTSCSAIWRFVNPSARSASTSRSRGVTSVEATGCAPSARRAARRDGRLGCGAVGSAERREGRGELEPRVRGLVWRSAPLVGIHGVLQQRPRALVLAGGCGEHAVGEVGGGPERRRADQALQLTQLAEHLACLFEPALGGSRADEQLEAGSLTGPLTLPAQALRATRARSADRLHRGQCALDTVARPQRRPPARAAPPLPSSDAAAAAARRAPSAARSHWRGENARGLQLRPRAAPPPPPSGRARGERSRTWPGRSRACSGCRSASANSAMRSHHSDARS